MHVSKRLNLPLAGLAETRIAREHPEFRQFHFSHLVEDFDDGENDSDTEYEYNDMTVELDEEDVDSPNGNNNESAINLAMQLPCKYIDDLILI